LIDTLHTDPLVVARTFASFWKRRLAPVRGSPTATEPAEQRRGLRTKRGRGVAWRDVACGAQALANSVPKQV